MSSQTATIHINQGTIHLPDQLVAEMDGLEATVTKTNGSLVITPKTSPKVDRRKKIDAWKQAAGMWKDKNIPDPVEWQRQIRDEWERDLPNPR